MDTAAWKKEHDKCTAYYNNFIEDDKVWFEKQKNEWLENHPNATLDEAFSQGYILSEDHPLSRTIHNIVLYVDDYYKFSKLNIEYVVKKIFELFRMKDINYKQNIETPNYD